MTTLPVSVIGAGVAGTVLAHALRTHGIDCRLFERRNRERFSGGALLLWSNAVRALAEVGLDAGPRSFGQELELVDFVRAEGQLLWRLPVAQLARRHRAPCVVVPRAEFLDYLDQRVLGLVEHQMFERYDLAAEQVTTTFKSGVSHTSSLLVGADGLHSAVRRQLEERPSELRGTGQSIWVGSCAFRHPNLVPGRAVASMGRGQRFWAAALGAERVYWYAIFPEEWAPSSAFQLAQRFRDFHRPVEDLVLETPEENIAKTSICDRSPTDTWGTGRMTLLGDAIHPVTPDIGQGACQAIESAVTLAEELTKNGLTQRALRDYERRRRERTARISNLSYLTSIGSTARDPWAKALRDCSVATALPFLAPPLLDWIMTGRHALPTP
jgi:2-polyprenyl-6-methoxyphenol hydroxylase-like FAD-dependent oxidoreductase